MTMFEWLPWPSCPSCGPSSRSKSSSPAVDGINGWVTVIVGVEYCSKRQSKRLSFGTGLMYQNCKNYRFGGGGIYNYYLYGDVSVII